MTTSLTPAEPSGRVLLAARRSPFEELLGAYDEWIREEKPDAPLARTSLRALYAALLESQFQDNERLSSVPLLIQRQLLGGVEGLAGGNLDGASSSHRRRGPGESGGGGGDAREEEAEELAALYNRGALWRSSRPPSRRRSLLCDALPPAPPTCRNSEIEMSPARPRHRFDR